MTYTALPGLVLFGDILGEVASAKPYTGPPMPIDSMTRDEFNTQLSGYIDAAQSWEIGICNFVFAAMEEKREYANLVVDDPNLPKKSVSNQALRFVPYSSLKCSHFNAIDYRLESLRPYNHATIFVTPGLAAAVRKRLCEKSEFGGRPEHPAKSWYAEQGFRRDRRSIKQLQREMEVALGVKPPSESTIRSWENIRKNIDRKPPTESLS